MFCQPPDEESQKSRSVTSHKKNRKAKKKNKNKFKREAKKKQLKFANTMSAWAENFAVAATWQLKHQVAYWKARAKALEYENTVLHDVIRRNNVNVRFSSQTEKEPELRTETEDDNSETESDSCEEVQDEEDFEVSEEFIQFLTANAKFKEDAKKEREQLKAKEEETEEVVEEERETSEENRHRMKDLYGDRWQRICALEMSLLTSFIHDSDQSKPQYWPNIPFNFKSS